MRRQAYLPYNYSRTHSLGVAFFIYTYLLIKVKTVRGV